MTCPGDATTRWVAASVGPYGAVLADGSEYRGRYGLSRAALRDFHLPRMELLASADPDFLAVETIPDVDEAEVLVELLDELGVSAWFSFSVSGSRTRADQPLADAFSVAGSASSVFAVGVNCCSPDDVLDAVRLATEVTGKPAVAYPNSGEAWDAPTPTVGGCRRLRPDARPEWLVAGASFVGGCCRVGPSTIAAVAERCRARSARMRSQEIRRLLLGTFVRPQEETGTGLPRVEAGLRLSGSARPWHGAARHRARAGGRRDRELVPAAASRARRGAPRLRDLPGRHRLRRELPPALRPLRRQPAAGRAAGHVPAP